LPPPKPLRRHLTYHLLRSIFSLSDGVLRRPVELAPRKRTSELRTVMSVMGQNGRCLCGPTRFMADMKEALAALDVAPEQIHVEVFNGSESMTPGVVGAATRAPHRPRIAAHWNASGYQSILELAEACDVPVRWSCRTGACHNCESGLVSGSVA